jgi:hypothetical protein
MIEKTNKNPPDRRARTGMWIGFAAFCAILIVGAITLIVTFGVPGNTGGTSPSQQQSSGAPLQTNEIRDGDTRQNTTGYGDKSNQ